MKVSGKLHVPAVLHPGKNPGTLWVGGCVGPWAGLESFEKSLLPVSEFKSRTLQPVA